MQKAEFFTSDSGYDRFFKTIHNTGCDKLSPIIGRARTSYSPCRTSFICLRSS